MGDYNNGYLDGQRLANWGSKEEFYRQSYLNFKRGCDERDQIIARLQAEKAALAEQVKKLHANTVELSAYEKGKGAIIVRLRDELEKVDPKNPLNDRKARESIFAPVANSVAAKHGFRYDPVTEDVVPQ